MVLSTTGSAISVAFRASRRIFSRSKSRATRLSNFTLAWLSSMSLSPIHLDTMSQLLLPCVTSVAHDFRRQSTASFIRSRAFCLCLPHSSCAIGIRWAGMGSSLSAHGTGSSLDTSSLRCVALASARDAALRHPLVLLKKGFASSDMFRKTALPACKESEV